MTQFAPPPRVVVAAFRRTCIRIRAEWIRRAPQPRGVWLVWHSSRQRHGVWWAAAPQALRRSPRRRRHPQGLTGLIGLMGLTQNNIYIYVILCKTHQTYQTCKTLWMPTAPWWPPERLRRCGSSDPVALARTVSYQSDPPWLRRASYSLRADTNAGAAECCDDYPWRWRELCHTYQTPWLWRDLCRCDGFQRQLPARASRAL
jgi:hypothetical protein